MYQKGVGGVMLSRIELGMKFVLITIIAITFLIFLGCQIEFVPEQDKYWRHRPFPLVDMCYVHWWCFGNEYCLDFINSEAYTNP